MLPADGTCVIEIESLPRAFSDQATMAEMRSAALNLLDTCLFKKLIGGITIGLGKFRKDE